jgi:signal transduction histidine kinase/ActR/RegA family two-component response regulator
LAIEVLQAAARTKAIRIEWVFLPEGPEEALRSGKADAWPMIVSSPPRAREFALSRPWVTTSLWLVNRRGASTNLDGGKIGVHRAQFPMQYAAQRFPRAIVVAFDSRPEALRSICRGEIQAALIESRNFLGLLLNRPDGCEAVPLEGTPLRGATLELSIISPKSLSALPDTLRAGIDDAAKQGLLATYFERSQLGAGGEGTSFESLLRSEQANADLWKVLAALAVSLSAVAVLAVRLRRTERLAVLANTAKSRFLAQMSHEIRTPMNGVLGMAELLLASPLPPRERELAQTISTSGTTLMTILNDILDMSKLEAGKLEIEAIDYCLPEVLTTVRRTLEPLAAAKALDLSVWCDPKVPPWLKGDPVRLSQILLNLGTNGIKFTDRGSVRIEAGTTPGGELFLRVSDTGIGIPLQHQAKLFTAFTQASVSTARTHGGTGLGLAICKLLVDRMNGTIGLTSSPGVGTSFTVELPLSQGVRPSAATTATDPAAKTRPLRILVAEDNSVNQRVTQGLLERLGHTVDIAGDGEAAVQCWAARSYDAILMDRQMPILDGIEATRAIRRREKAGQHVWVIALTASALDQDRRECLESGMDDYVSKPVSSESLKTALARAPSFLTETPTQAS